jgi:acyl-CoA synthetase (AMP-forming)/AMP-acid ligase II
MEPGMNEFYGCRTVRELIPRQARARPDAIALIYRERSATYGELNTRAKQIANGLIAMGIRPGDRIAYLGKNSDLYFELLFGAIAANIVLAPVNWRLAPREMASLLRDAEAKVLFVGRGFAAIAATLDLPALDQFVAMDEAHSNWVQFEEWRDAQSSNDPVVPVAPEDTVLQLYTSGTTGLPKGVELMNTNILTLIDCYESYDVMRLSPDDVALVCMPVFHIAGTGVGLLCLAQGAQTLVLEEVKVAEIIDAITRYQVNWLLLVPAVILMLTQHVEAAPIDLGCVRSLAYGASPIAEDVVVRAMRAFPNASFRQVYGSTESAAVATFLTSDLHDPVRGKLRSCGRPYSGIGLRVVDPNGETLPTGQVGEIVIQGPCVMKGYWKNPVATREAFFAGGWLRTGDAGYFDKEGFLYIYDRVKDMIVTGAENVYPAEVENALFGHPAIADAAVIGVPDPRWGEAVKAIVVLKQGVEATAEEIIAYARERIAGFKLPKSIDFVTALPRNPTGKVLRRELRAPYWQGHDRQVS